MYEAYFGLKSRPFPSTPRPDRYFSASAVENSRQTLVRCIERAEGPGLLVGGPGTGKSLLCSLLADQFRERFHLVKLDHAQFCTRRALLQAVMFELNLPYRGLDEGELRLALIEFAKSTDMGRDGLLLLIDEAQTLPVRLIEEVRMITNVVVGSQPRVRLVLSGNPSLDERLASPKLESLSQRIAARCYLQPLSYDETTAYIRAQFAAAGGDPEQVLAGDIWQAVYHASGGIPRLVNQVCDHALMLAAVAQRRSVDAALIEEAWADLQQLPLPWPTKTPPSKAAETVVEFGSLASGDDDDEACGDVVPQSLAVARPEVINLTSQLDQIGLQVEEWDTLGMPLPEVVPQQDNTACEEPTPPAATIQPARLGSPFGDCFEEEETVQDHYASLEAKSRMLGKRPLSPQEHEFASALQTIFQPPASDSKADRPTVPLAGVSAAAPASQEIDESADREEDIAVGTAGDMKEIAEDAAEDEEPSTLRVAALRDLPPDDSDLIVVMDAEAHAGLLSRTPGKAHRQEYRHLFTKLRDS